MRPLASAEARLGSFVGGTQKAQRWAYRSFGEAAECNL